MCSSDHEWGNLPVRGLSQGMSPSGSVSEVMEEDGLAAKPSMRLVSQILRGDRKRVSQVQPDGSEIVIWEGSISEWLTWKEPESLRGTFSSEMEVGAPLSDNPVEPEQPSVETTRTPSTGTSLPSLGSAASLQRQTREEELCA